MKEQFSNPLTATELLNFLLRELKRQLPPEQFADLIRATEFNINPVPASEPSDHFTWLGGKDSLGELYQYTVVRDEIFLVSSEEIFFQHFVGKNVPEEKLVITTGRIGDALYLLNQFRNREIHLLGRDAYLHRQMVFHCTGEHGPLNIDSLRKMISRGCIRSESRRDELDLMIEDILWVHKTTEKK